MNMLGRGGSLVTLLAVVATAACSAATPADRAGGATIVLKLGTIDKVNPDNQSFGTQAFVDNLPKVSAGHIKVDVVQDYGAGAASSDVDLIKAIGSGELDGGWVGTRGFGAAGIHGLEAFEAPMVITSYAAQKALIADGVTTQALRALDQSGVVGLGIAVGALRRPFAAKAALVGPQDWKGVKFRTFNSAIQSETVTTLGAAPVNVGLDWVDEVVAGRLRGAEFSLGQYQQAGLGKEAGNVTGNVVLWPKMFVLMMSRAKFDAMSVQQRSWIREAADLGVKASVDATYDESSVADDLCTRGVRFKDATPAQLLALRTRLAPVLDRLAADPSSGPLLTTIKAHVQQHPATETLKLDDRCRQGASVDDRTSGVIPKTTAGIPDGVYRVQITADEVLAAGLDNRDGNSGTWTFTVRRGRYEMRCRPIAAPGQDCGGSTQSGALDSGQLRGKDDLVYLVSDGDSSVRLQWTLASDGLRFVNPQQVHGWELVLKPWQKIE
jgi:TRAP-type C4-dicarboxylate transport system substrate-binding protein